MAGVLLERSDDLTLYDQMQRHFPVIFEKRIVALKLLQCSLRNTNMESGFVRGAPSAMVTVRVGLVGESVAMWSSFPRRRLDWAAGVLFSFILVGCAARPGPEVLMPVASPPGEKTLQ